MRKADTQPRHLIQSTSWVVLTLAELAQPRAHDDQERVATMPCHQARPYFGPGLALGLAQNLPHEVRIARLPILGQQTKNNGKTQNNKEQQMKTKKTNENNVKD